MTTSTETTTPQKPLWLYLFGIIDQPVATFQAVLTQRRWLTWALPLLVVSVAFAALAVAQIPYVVELTREQTAKQLAALPADQAEAARSTIEFTTSLPFLLATTLGVGLVTLLLGVLIQSTLLYFGVLLIGGSDEMKFGTVFAMSSWARIPIAIGYLAQAGFSLVAKETIKYPGLSFLVSTGDLLADAKKPLVALLGSIDLFWLWHLLLVMLGLAVAARFSRGKSLLLTLIYAALTLGLTVLPSLIFGGMGGQ
jgi:hypothetical protein